MPDPSTAMIERFEAMLAQGKDSPMLRYGLGLEYAKRDEHDRAVEHFKSAVELDPGYSAAWKVYGRSLQALERWAEAAAVYEKGIDVAQGKGDRQAAKEMGVFLRRCRKALGESE